MSLYEVKSKRGVLLSVLLVLLAIVQAWVIYRGLVVWNLLVSHGRDGWVLPLVGAALAALALVAIVGVWFWRRWAVYLLAVVVVIGVVSDAWFGLASFALLIRLVLLGLLAWLIRSRWRSFR
ncbi:hypothetical protein [Pseudonocardia spinosispora]|uniref:hypothetical protein n=1 Tax=Pseudonocardia spinosispora TaxID=103441 RepID=UPI00040B3B0A|nr:hypothetical protein [Pseudonocardia spinosispora]